MTTEETINVATREIEARDQAKGVIKEEIHYLISQIAEYPLDYFYSLNTTDMFKEKTDNEYMVYELAAEAISEMANNINS